MNDPNWFETANAVELKDDGLFRRLWNKLSGWRYPLLLVVLPTLLVAGYYYLIAADQYESSADFIVSSNASPQISGGSFGSLLGIAPGGSTQGEAMAVPAYLESHQVISDLGKQLDLEAIFRRPEADMLSKLSPANSTPESLLRYYQKMVSVHYNQDTGIISLSVRAFRPADAYAISTRLLQLGEQQVNRMNRRRYQDAVSVAQEQMEVAEQRIASIQGQMTAFRQAGSDIDPQLTGDTQIKLVANLQAQLATARAQLGAMGAAISTSSPQYVAMRQQVAALESQVAAQSAKLTGGGRTIAPQLGKYEDLKIQQEFAAKNFEAAAASLTAAKNDAAKQQLFIVRVVDANKPVKSLFPKRGQIVLMTFIALCTAYGIGWLILAGVKEHGA